MPVFGIGGEVLTRLLKQAEKSISRTLLASLTEQPGWLYIDQSDDRLRCPCHGASCSPTGQLLPHPGPTALAPLPRLEICDVTGAIEGSAPPTISWLGCQPGVTRIPIYLVSTHGNGTAISIPTSRMRGLWPASSGLVASTDDNHARIEQP